MHTTLLRLISRNWKWVLLRGILAILFGVAAFSWPRPTLGVLVLLYGAYTLADGFLALASAIRGGSLAPRWWLALVGVLGVVAGCLVIAMPRLSALLLLIFIGVTAIVRGLLEIAGAIALRKEIDNERWLIFAGLASVIFGALVLAFPAGGALAMIWAIAAYSILFGGLLVALALRLRNHAAQPTPPPAA